MLGSRKQAAADMPLPSRVQRRHSWFVWVAVAVIVGNLAYVAVRLWPSRAVPQFGDPMPEWQAVTTDGRSLSSASDFGGHLGVLLYADRLPTQPLLRYMQVLLDRYRDHGAGLRVIVAVGPEHLAAGVVEEAAARVSYPVAADADGRLRRTLGLAAHEERSFLIAPDGTVTLSVSGVLGREELRQHVEKHLLGKIEYELSPVTLLGPEALLPNWEVRRFGDELDEEVHPYKPFCGNDGRGPDGGLVRRLQPL